MLNKHFCVTARTPMSVPLKRVTWPVSLALLCPLGLGAEDMGKLSGNILSHAESPCLVAWFSPFLPTPVLPLPEILWGILLMWMCLALGKSGFWNANPFLFLGQPVTEHFRILCSNTLDGKIFTIKKNVTALEASLYTISALSLKRCNIILEHTSPQKLYFCWFFAFMWCLFGNTRKGLAEIIGVAGTDSFLGWTSSSRRVGKRSDKRFCNTNPPTGAKSRSPFLASSPLMWVWM